jgi:hypothetical protein
MTSGIRHRLGPGLIAPLVAAALVASLVAVVAAWQSPAPAVAATTTYSRTMPFATWEVPVGDIASLGQPRTYLLVKSFSPTMDVVKYLDTAWAHGQRVVVYFRDTVDDARGIVYPSRVKAWVDKVKRHPALFGYLTVKEPSWIGISVTEMRALYKAYRAADPVHRVIALLGDVPHFGTSANPWTTGIATMLWVNWYPVTYSRGYIGTASTHFPKVRAVVDRVNPNVPVWLMVQGHGNRPGDRRTPTTAELERQVRDGFRYLKPQGIVFYTWNNALYDRDLKRNPALWAAARSIVTRVRAGTF